MEGNNRGRRRIKGLRPEGAFALVAGLFGLAMVFVTPPLQVPDEPHHWFRVYQLSQGQVIGVRRVGPGQYEYGGPVPVSIVACCSTCFKNLEGYPGARVHVSDILGEFRRPLRPDEDRVVAFPNTALYSPIPYLPAVACMAVDRLTSPPPVALLYLGRLGTLAAYVGLGWAAIRVTPVLKWPMAVILTCPMNLFLAASVSADAVTTGIAVLASAWALACCVDPGPMTWRKTVGLGALMVGLALCKSAYVPLAGMAFAIPARRWARRGWLASTSIVLSAGLVVILWSAVTHPAHVHEEGDDPSRQMAWVSAHPATYARVFVHTMGTSMPAYVEEMVGNLGWLDTPLPWWFAPAFCAVVLHLILVCGEPVSLGARPRLMAAIAVVASVMVIGLATYLVWDKIGATRLEGIQGRYFLPLTLLGGALLHRRHGRAVRPDWVLTFMVFVGLYALLTMVRRYYLGDYAIVIG